MTMAENALIDRWWVKLCAAALALAGATAVAAVDFITGYETAVALFYLIPLSVAVWFSWRYVGILTAVLSGVSDVVVNYASTKEYSTMNAWNSVIQISFFVVFAYVLLGLKASERHLRQLARTDPLTGSANSRLFAEAGTAEIQRAMRYEHPFTVAFMDMDDFKGVNDTFGHSAGDALLREIASRVRSTIRRTDTMARLGGDEFAILFPETARDGAGAIIERLRAALTDIRVQGDRPVTFSIGVVTDTGKRCTFDEILKAADSLMYKAKREGKNTVRYGAFDETTCVIPQVPYRSEKRR